MASIHDYHELTTDRLCAWILYMIAYGVMLEIALFYARYLRRFEEHDEIHATLVIMTFMLTMFFDVYYYFYVEVIRSLQDTEHWVSVVITILINALVVLQILFGTYIRKQMRSPKRSSSDYYYISKSVHKWSGYLVWALTKVKLVLVSNKLSKSYESKVVEAVCVFYIASLLITRIIGEAILKFGNKWFQQKRIDPGQNRWNTNQKKIHNKIIEMLGFTEIATITKIYPKCNIIFVEDRIYDIEGLDHPGGQFVFNQIRGKEISRYFFGAQKFEFLECRPSSSFNRHSSFAYNLLQTRFIGFLPDNGFFRTIENFKKSILRDTQQDTEDKTQIDFLRSTYTLLQKNNVDPKRFENINLNFEWAITHSVKIHKNSDIRIVTLENTDDIFVNLKHAPFKLWGKAFNIRHPNFPRDVRQYSFVSTLQNNQKEVIDKLWLKYFDMVPGIKQNKEIKDIIKKIENQGVKFEESKEIKFSKNTEKVITLLVRRRGVFKNKMARILTKNPQSENSNNFLNISDEKFSINGPWGTGLEIRRGSSGPYVIFAQGTGVLPFIDLFHFIVRKLIHMSLVRIKLSNDNIETRVEFQKNVKSSLFDNDHHKSNIIKEITDEITSLDVFDEDLLESFNHISFSIYLSFTNLDEYKYICGDAIDMIVAIQKFENQYRIKENLKNQSDPSKKLEQIDLVKKVVVNTKAETSSVINNYNTNDAKNEQFQIDQGKKDSIQPNLEDIIKMNYDPNLKYQRDLKSLEEILKKVENQKIKEDNLSEFLDLLGITVVHAESENDLFQTKLDDGDINKAMFQKNRRKVTKILVAGDTKFNKLFYDTCESSGISKKRLKFV